MIRHHFSMLGDRGALARAGLAGAIRCDAPEARQASDAALRARSGCVVPAVFDFAHQRDKIDRERGCEVVEVDHPDVAQAALHVAHVRGVEAGALGEALLGHAARDAQAANGGAKRPEKLVRCPASHRLNVWPLRR